MGREMRHDSRSPPDRDLVGPRSTPQRSDSRATRRRMLEATGRLLAEVEPPRSVQHIAHEAGVSTATAYRHFASLDDVLHAYAHQTVLAMGDYAAAQSATGYERLELLSREWVRLVRERGPAMVHLRSHRGFLERRRAEERIIADTCAYLEPAVAGVIAEEGLPPATTDFGLFVWNVLFDPREVLDLLGTLGWTEDVVVDRLLATFLAALRTRPAG
jgi:AcrR family transcriptional regulator